MRGLTFHSNILSFLIISIGIVSPAFAETSIDQYGVSVKARVFQIYGKCTILDCNTMKYLIEVASVYENRDNLSNTEVSILSVCGSSILALGESYRINLKKIGKIYSNIDDSINSDPDLVNEKRIRNCQYKIVSYKKE